MPLRDVTIANPYADAQIPGGWAYISRSDFDWAAKTVRLQVETYTSKAAADAGKAPIQPREYFFPAEDFLPLLAAHAQTYIDLAAVLDGLVAAKPEFAGATVEPAWVTPPAEG